MEETLEKLAGGGDSDYRPVFEFAQNLKLSESFLISQAKNGRLKAFLLDDYWLTRQEWVNDWLHGLRGEIINELPTGAEPKINPRDYLLPAAAVAETLSSSDVDAAAAGSALPADALPSPDSIPDAAQDIAATSDDFLAYSQRRPGHGQNLLALAIGIIFLLGLILLFLLSLQA